MRIQTFPHDVVKELHDGDPAIRVIVEQLWVNSGGKEFPERQKGEEEDVQYIKLYFDQRILFLERVF